MGIILLVDQYSIKRLLVEASVVMETNMIISGHLNMH